MSSFPSITSLEPPPLDSTSEDEDSFEFRTPAGLKLDLQSAEPSPLSTPRKSAKPLSISSLSLPATTTSTSEENGHSDSDSGGANHWDCENVEIDVDVDVEEEDDFKDCLNEDQDVQGAKQGQLSTVSSSLPPPLTSDVERDVDVDIIPIPSTPVQLEENEIPLQAPTEELTTNHGDNGVDVENSIEDPETTICTELEEDVQISSTVADDIPPVGEVQPQEQDDDYQDFAASEKVEQEQDSSSPDSDSVTNSKDAPETSPFDEEGFGDFAVFQTSQSEITPPPVAEADGDNNRDDLKTLPIPPAEPNDLQDDDDDDFGDFTSNNFQQSAPTPSTSTVVHPPQAPVLLDPGGSGNQEDDDFEDFANFQQMPSTSSHSQPSELYSTSSTITSPRSSADFTAAREARIDTLIKTVIPIPISPSTSPSEEAETKDSPQSEAPPPEENTTCTLTPLEKELSETKDCCWGHTVDFEESRALLHKWPHSSSQQRFYQSLKIDTSTIVYTEKWGAIEVPRCAAGMVEKPILQPQILSRMNDFDSPQPQRKSSASTQEDNPVIPNGKPPQQQQQLISAEALQIIQKIPDISYMTSKTLVFPQAASSSSSRSNSLL